MHVAAVLAAHRVGIAADGDDARWDGPDALTAPAAELLQQAGLAQRIDDGVEGFFLLFGIQGAGWGEGALQPVLGPGGAAGVAHQLLEAPFTAVAGEKDRPAGGASKLRGVGDLVEGIGVLTAALEVAADLAVAPHQLAQRKGTALAQVLQQAHHQLLQFTKAKAAQRLNLVRQPSEQAWQQLVHGCGIHSSRQGPRLLHRRAQA